MPRQARLDVAGTLHHTRKDRTLALTSDPHTYERDPAS